MTTDERIEKVENQLAHMRWINGCLIAGVILCLVTCVVVVLCLEGTINGNRVDNLEERLERLEKEQRMFGIQDRSLKGEKRLDSLESKVLMLENKELERELGYRK